ncbi:MAG: HAMP domain-containing histidine kinase, partial [Clostridia bacterium]|nr:HAMP domain-containing histidine kinase [Clostridia bacterium]
EAKNNTEFISDISHQLKTPLAGLRLYCEMEHNSTPSNHTEKELVLISKMEKLIYNVLKLEKIRSDTYVMNFEETELSDLLLDLKAEFATLFPNKTITVKGGGSLRTDKSWLREALGNVIKNACEHTKADGKVDIIIEEAEKSVSVIIEDNGGGVHENELPMLFRRFHRTENASPDSAGIGLSITKAIVEKHHGTITAENSEKGLRVVMCFPIIDANLKL